MDLKFAAERRRLTDQIHVTTEGGVMHVAVNEDLTIAEICEIFARSGEAITNNWFRAINGAPGPYRCHIHVSPDVPGGAIAWYTVIGNDSILLVDETADIDQALAAMIHEFNHIAPLFWELVVNIDDVHSAAHGLTVGR